MASARNSLPPGARLDNYTITKTIGGGGFSVVYLAADEISGQPTVIKEYMPGRLATRSADGEVVPRAPEDERGFKSGRALFFQEASTLATVKHPNIVSVHNFFNANGTVYMVMAYEEGKNLQHYISKRRGKLSEAFLLTVFPALLDGLQVIHQHGYLHLDIKPSNIHLRPGGRPLLLDFGAVHRRLNSRQLQPGQVVSAGFSPVEQYGPNGYVGPWTDIYAIGATMRACIDGHPPADARERRNRDPMRPAAQEFRRQYSPELLEALDWALEVDPLLRPQKIEEFMQALPVLEPEPEPASGNDTILSRLTGRARG
jgi:serine/threonine protein kinase